MGALVEAAHAVVLMHAVSMPRTASALPPGRPEPGELVDLICPEQSVDDVAALAGTIGYEILTGLGRRFCRRYEEEGEPARPA